MASTVSCETLALNCTFRPVRYTRPVGFVGGLADTGAAAWRLGKFAASATAFTCSALGACLSVRGLGAKALTSTSGTFSKILARVFGIRQPPPLWNPEL